MSKRAEDLLGLLEEHVKVQRQAQTYLTRAIAKDFSSSVEEKECYSELTRWQRNLMFDCEVLGFKYFQLEKIIPNPFKTTDAERVEILEDLKQYAEAEYA